MNPMLTLAILGVTLFATVYWFWSVFVDVLVMYHHFLIFLAVGGGR